MKKTLLIFLSIAALTAFSAKGNGFYQGGGGLSDVESTFDKGDFVINVGFGFGRTPRGTTQIPPITVSGEYGLVQDIFTERMVLGIGGIFGIQTYRYYRGFPHYEYVNEVSLSFAVRGALHYPLVNNFDVHAGVITGFRTNPGRAIVGTYVGGRYYFTDNFAAMAEVGYGITYINLGVAFKF